MESLSPVLHKFFKKYQDNHSKFLSAILSFPVPRMQISLLSPRGYLGNAKPNNSGFAGLSITNQ